MASFEPNGAHPHVTALKEKKKSLLTNLTQLNAQIKRIQDTLSQAPKNEVKKQDLNDKKKKQVQSTRGFAPRNALLHELRRRVAKGRRWNLKPTTEFIMWKDNNVKTTAAFEMAAFNSIAATDGMVLHDVVTINGGGNNRVSFCIPMNSAEYTFRHLIHDLNRLWDLPSQTLAPYFQLVANADPLIDGEYDFVPQRFDPDALVKGSLLDLQQDPDRGYGTQTGVPGNKLPPLHCSPIVAGDTIDALINAAKSDQLLFFNAVATNQDLNNLDASTNTNTNTNTEQNQYEKGNGNRNGNGNASTTSSVMTKEQYVDRFLPRLALGKDHEDTEDIFEAGKELFTKWGDEYTDEITGLTQNNLKFESFCWLLEQWGDKRKTQRNIHENMSARKAWKVFDKPSRFVGGGTTTVRFDEFAAAIRLHNPDITTSKLHLLFDKMDSDRGGSVTYDEFYAFWSTLKVDLFEQSTEDNNGLDDALKLKDIAMETLQNKFPFFFKDQDFEDLDDAEKKGTLGAARDVAGYSIFYFLFIVLVLWRRDVLSEFQLTSALDETFEMDGRFGTLSHLSYSDISSRDDLWDWLQGPVSAAFISTKETSYIRAVEDASDATDSMKISGMHDKLLGVNKLIPSTLRLRQLRVAGQKCSTDNHISTAAEPFNLCFPKYSTKNRQSDTIVAFDKSSFATGNTWTNPLSTDSPFTRLAERTTGGIVAGVDTYDSTGYVVDLIANTTEWTSTLANLREKEWFSQTETRALIVQFVVFNPTINSIVQIDFLAEFFPNGGMSVSSKYRPMVFDLYTSLGDQILLGIEVLILLGAILKILSDLVVLVPKCCAVVCHSCGACCTICGCHRCARCCHSRNASAAGAAGAAGSSITYNSNNNSNNNSNSDQQMIEIEMKNRNSSILESKQEDDSLLMNDPNMHHDLNNRKDEEDTENSIATFALLVDLALCAAVIAAGCARFAFYVSTQREMIVQSTKTQNINMEFIDLSGAAWYNEFGYSADGFIALFLPLKLLTKMNRLANCQRTKLFIQVLTHTAEHAVHVFILYVIVIFVYAVLGHYLFAPYLQEYISFQHTTMTLVLISIGKFDYYGLERVHPITAFIYFFSYIIIMLLILTKFFTAVVNHEYRVLAVEARDEED